VRPTARPGRGDYRRPQPGAPGSGRAGGLLAPTSALRLRATGMSERIRAAAWVGWKSPAPCSLPEIIVIQIPQSGPPYS